jgi:hypothetical protein
VSDTRIVYGAGCLWWDNVEKAASRGGIPCCPFCGSVLFEVSDQKIWDEWAKRFEEDGHPNYTKLLTFMRGKCFKKMEDAEKAFAAQGEKGKENE